jgi:hypothetical protein
MALSAMRTMDVAAPRASRRYDLGTEVAKGISFLAPEVPLHVDPAERSPVAADDSTAAAQIAHTPATRIEKSSRVVDQTERCAPAIEKVTDHSSAFLIDVIATNASELWARGTSRQWLGFLCARPGPACKISTKLWRFCAISQWAP